jgi:hypothetical protein
MVIDTVQHEIIARAVRATTPWFLDVELQARHEGWEAIIRLNPTMAKVRATEQGIADRSLAAAADDIRVRQMWDSYIARANNRLPPDAQIIAYTPVLDTAIGSQ